MVIPAKEDQDDIEKLDIKNETEAPTHSHESEAPRDIAQNQKHRNTKTGERD